MIKSHIMNKEWSTIKERLGEWSARFSQMQGVLAQAGRGVN